MHYQSFPKRHESKEHFTVEYPSSFAELINDEDAY